MPSVRFIKKSRTFGKEPRKMSNSLIDILTGNSALPELEVVVEPSAVTGQGGGTPVFANVDTNKIISPNSFCKYINFRFQLAQNDTNTNGWFEYAIVLFTEQDTAPTNTGLGDVNIKSLGDICNNKFRGKCLWNGAVPINQDQAKVVDLAIKIPDKWCKWQRGQYLCLIHYYRPADAISSDTIKNLWSTQWKCYV